MAVGYNPRMVTNGLVLCLDAGNIKSYPGSGTAWTDLSGNGNNGTLTNGPTFSSSNGGNIVFDGVDDYVTGSIPSLSTWTMSIWYYSLEINVASAYYPFGLLSGNSIGFGGTFASIQNKWYYRMTDGSVHIGPSITINTWYNLVVTKTSTIYNLYTNGLISLSDQTGLDTTTTSYSIGRRVEGVLPAKGYVANANVYNRVLSASEISQNFNALRGRFGI